MTDRVVSGSDVDATNQEGKILARIDYKPPLNSSFHLKVDLELPGAGVTMIYGASGSGKTTLLRCIAGLERPKSAEIYVANECWQSKDFFRKTHKRSLGFVFQEASLFPFMTVQRNLDLAAGSLKAGTDKCFFDEVVELMGIEGQLQRKPSDLSGGERQRVAIARALLLKPTVLLFDEPLASLDNARKQEILPYLEKLQTQSNTPILYVTHSDDEVMRLANYLVVLEHGACIGMGSIENVVSDLNLPFSNFSDRSAVFSGRVVKRVAQWGLLLVEFEGGALWITDNSQEIGANIRLRIKASDVSIALTDHQDTSILNRLAAVIVDIQKDESGSMCMLTLQLGATALLARVSIRSLESLNLKVGLTVWAQLKAVVIGR